MQLTNQQIIQLQARGLSIQQIETIAKQKGYTMPGNTDLLRKTGSVVNKIFPGKQVGQAIGTLGGFGVTAIRERLGQVPKGTTSQYDLSAPSPLQVAGDVAKGAASVAGARLPVASSILGKAGQFGALGGVSGGASGIAEGKSLGESAGQAARGAAVGALVGLTFGVVEKGIKAGTSGVGKVGTKIQQGVIRPSQTDFKDGFKMETIQKYNLGGSLQDTLNKTDRQLDDLAGELNKKLAQNNTSINMNKVYENTTKRLFGDKFAGFGSNTQLSSAAEKLQNEILYSSGPNGLVSIPEAQIIKRASGHYGAWQYGFTDPEAKASERVYNTFYNELKTEIERASPTGVKEINKRMSELIPIVNAVIRRIPVAERNRGLSLTDIVTLVGATIDPRALAITGINAAQKSGRFGNLLSKAPIVGEAINRGIGTIEQTSQVLFPNTR
jgi:hypothetical protein